MLLVSAWAGAPESFAMGFLALLFVGPMFAGLVDDAIAGRRRARLEKCALELRGHRLVQVDGSACRAEIDLTRPFTYRYLYKAEGEAIYRLRQGRAVLDFHSSDPLAESLAVALGLAWPPIGPGMKQVC